MRARLSEAAYGLIAERGHNALRIAAVAERAGVSQGALLHHFVDKNGITKASIEYALSQSTRASEERMHTPVDGPEQLLDLMIEDFTAFFMTDHFWVALGITVEASKNRELGRDIGMGVAAIRKRVYDGWEDKMREAGWSEAAAIEHVRTAAALIAGQAIRMLWSKPDETSRTIMRHWKEAALAARGN